MSEQRSEVLEALVEQTYRDPRRIRDSVEAAYAAGLDAGRSAPPLTGERKQLAERLRRKAKVVQEYDGRSALLEMAEELEAQ